jgi:hypothetical protein
MIIKTEYENMKQIIYIIGLVLIISNTSAQMSFNNKTVSVSGWGNDNNPKTTLCVITNNSLSTADSIISWSIISFDVPTGWQFDFCDPYDCVSNIELGSNNSFKLKTKTSGPLKGDFYSKSIPGNATIKIRLIYTNNSHNADTVILMAKGWATGLNNVKKQSEVTFFPNPTKDIITLKYETIKAINVTVYNVMGAKVKSFIHSSNETSLNISDLEKGLYHIRFSDNRNVTSKSFVKTE